MSNLSRDKSLHDDNDTTTRNGRGRLVALRTKDEVEASESEHTVPGYVVRIPQRAASEVVRAVDALVRSSSSRKQETRQLQLQHLRRLVKPGDMPGHLRREDGAAPEEGEGDAPSLYLFVCSTSVLPLPTITSALAALPAFRSPNPGPDVLTVPVPLNPPCSAVQAQRWSQEYWPTVYKRHNPFGPQPSAVAKAEAEIYPSAGRWMGLARRVAEEAWEAGIGAKVGAVVVDRGLEGGAQAVAVAGDGRWDGVFGAERGSVGEGGNAMAHAVMRAIGMVARRRKEVAARAREGPGQASPPLASDDTQAAGLATMEGGDGKVAEEEGNHFADQPLTPLERHVYSLADTMAPNGYLCLNLEIYITHEPCVMCSMAILHSRFGKVVFGVPMPWTGGMAAEALRPDGSHAGDIEEEGTDGQGDNERNARGAELPAQRPRYGLFWRRELHWRLLAWRWLDDEKEEQQAGEVDEHLHA